MKKLSLILSLLLIAVCCLFGLTACDNSKTITVGASATPHAEILEVVKPILQQQGWKLNIRLFDDYVLPNEGLSDGSLDANYFQHLPYLNEYNAEKGTNLVSVFAVHYEPYGIYAGTVSALAQITSSSTVAIPNDPSNCARALLLLEEQGLIKLTAGVGLTATANDIIDSQSTIKKANVVMLEARYVSQARSEKSIVVLNGNYAILAGLSVKNALATESASSTAAVAYANIIAVKAGNEQNEKILALVAALKSQAVLDFIAQNYSDGSVQAVFTL